MASGRWLISFVPIWVFDVQTYIKKLSSMQWTLLKSFFNGPFVVSEFVGYGFEISCY